MKVSDLVSALESLAPPALAESWDNVGLLLGDPADDLRGPVLLTIDLTPAVMDEALAAHAGALIAYHPPIFHPVRSWTSATVLGATALRAARAGMAIYSPHTALDAARDGLCDWLADGVGPERAGDRRALVPAILPDPRQTYKIVVFVPLDPPDALERVRNAMASAGAGRIGEYEMCSFTLAGTGTFRGSERSNPAVGQRGRLESVSETRLEMVCPGDALPVLIETLRAFHPYEEPAFDIYRLEGRPDRSIGAGRRVTLDQPASAAEIASRVKAYLGVERVRLAEPAAGQRVHRVGVCPGAGVSLLDAAIAQGCELFVTGEMKHHDILSALSRGCGVVVAGHTNTERGYLPKLARRLADTGFDARVSDKDREPTRLV